MNKDVSDFLNEVCDQIRNDMKASKERITKFQEEHVKISTCIEIELLHLTKLTRVLSFFESQFKPNS